MDVWSAFVPFAFSAIGSMIGSLFVTSRSRDAEIGRLEGREKEIEIAKEALSVAKASEAGRLDARNENLDQVVTESAAVTAAQKRIEVSLTGSEADRQWARNKKSKAYVDLLAISNKFSDLITNIATKHNEAILSTKGEKEYLEYLAQSSLLISEVKSLLSRIEIFGSEEFLHETIAALHLYARFIGSLKEAFSGKTQLTNQQNEFLASQRKLAKIARTDLNIDPAQ